MAMNLTSETDSEVIAHLLHQRLKASGNLLDAMHEAVKELDGAYAIAAIHVDDKNRLIVARNKSPLLIGIGIEENFAASDPLALSQLTNQFVFLEDGDVAEIDKETTKSIHQKILRSQERSLKLILRLML